jgi:hypothetical protein
MRGREYIRKVFREMCYAQESGASIEGDRYADAALEVIQELESPTKEEVLVQLVALELKQRRRRDSRVRRCA